MSEDQTLHAINLPADSRLHLFGIQVEIPGMIQGLGQSTTVARDVRNLRRNLISTYHGDPNHPEVRVGVYALDGDGGDGRCLGKLVMVGRQEPMWIPDGRTVGQGVDVRTGRVRERT